MNDIYQTSNAWPFEEARKIYEKIEKKLPKKGYILFETGYGPSGRPHIGTFGENARTVMVQNAFSKLTNLPTKLISFSDDMDGLRKIPDNIPNKDMVKIHLGKSLTSIPDPYGTASSFGMHMNGLLKEFLDHFNFKYDFRSATECYKSGQFDEALLNVLKNYDKIMEVMLPTLGEERQATYSPFLPVCKDTGIVLQVPIIEYNYNKGSIVYQKENGEKVETPVTGGHCKLQWKVDWAMRWYALDVDYEMHGKDLIPSAELSTKICRIMGKEPPVLFNYELFLDEKGQKISKSKGNGLTMEEWLKYAPAESLSYYMYQSPKKAKKLYFDIIPKQMDDYLTFLQKFGTQNEEEKLNNPVYHIHNGNPPKVEVEDISFSLLLNLSSVCNPDDESVLWGFIAAYQPNATKDKSPILANMVHYALAYYNDFVKPNKKFKTPTEEEKNCLKIIAEKLKTIPDHTSGSDIQNEIYAIAKEHFGDLKEFFKAMYEILLGQTQGPRLGSFIALYGIKSTIELIENKLK